MKGRVCNVIPGLVDPRVSGVCLSVLNLLVAGCSEEDETLDPPSRGLFPVS